MSKQKLEIIIGTEVDISLAVNPEFEERLMACIVDFMDDIVENAPALPINYTELEYGELV